jgi:hypothetical protein
MTMKESCETQSLKVGGKRKESLKMTTLSSEARMNLCIMKITSGATRLENSKVNEMFSKSTTKRCLKKTDGLKTL